MPFDEHQIEPRELIHRFRNILTIMRSIISGTLRSAQSIEGAQALVDQRLGALSGTIDGLLASERGNTPLEAVTSQVLAQFPRVAKRFSLDGETVDVGVRSAMTLTLVLHELCTNAIRYGALSSDVGNVELRWTVIRGDEDPQLWMLWCERDGPVVEPPTHQGFGTRLICTAAGRSLRGRCELDFPKSGVTWSLLAPLSSLKT